eukprot:829686-Pleurochrysis_carterae.AAC.1
MLCDGCARVRLGSARPCNYAPQLHLGPSVASQCSVQKGLAPVVAGRAHAWLPHARGALRGGPAAPD